MTRLMGAVPQYVLTWRWAILGFGALVAVTAAWFLRRASARLRALPPPKADRGRVNRILSFMEQQTDVLHQAASAGGTARVRTLGEERIHLTHQKDGLVYRLASLWGVSPEALYRCPVSLPA